VTKDSTDKANQRLSKAGKEEKVLSLEQVATNTAVYGRCAPTKGSWIREGMEEGWQRGKGKEGEGGCVTPAGSGPRR